MMRSVLLSVLIGGITMLLIVGTVTALLEQKQIQSALENGTDVACLWESSVGVHSQGVYLVQTDSHSYVVCVEDGEIQSSMEVVSPQE